jgi:hypothetical protein
MTDKNPASRPANGEDAPTSGGLRAALVALDSDGREAAYPMYEVAVLSAGGAFLTGPVLIEVGEALTIALQSDGREEMRVHARVAALDRTQDSGIEVIFTQLSDEARDFVATHARDHRAAMRRE